MRIISFKDPTSKVYSLKNKVIRQLSKDSYDFYKHLRLKNIIKKKIEKKKIQDFFLFEEDDKFIMSHEKYNFIIKANEISSFQLYLFGRHTLELLEALLNEDLFLKDASAWNLGIINGEIMFLDICSIEKWTGSKYWLAYGQFIRHFLIPLIINKETKIPVSFLFNHYLDGIPPKTAKKILGLKCFKSLNYLEDIYLPSLFDNKKLNQKKNINYINNQKEKNKKIFSFLISRLKNKLETLKPKNLSFWSNYTKNRDHYNQLEIQNKISIFSDFIKDKKGKLLDIGCNTGEFLQESLSNSSLEIYGYDNDEECINICQEKLSDKKVSLSHVDFSNPSNSLGWENKETIGILNKSENFFDIVVFFGILHHLLVTFRIPLSYILSLLSKITKQYLIIEFVPPHDEKFIQLAGFNIKLYKYLNEEIFENELSKHFRLLKKKALSKNSRVIYILQKLT